MLSRNAALQKKDCLRSQFTFAVIFNEKKDCFRSLLFLAGAVGIEPTP